MPQPPQFLLPLALFGFAVLHSVWVLLGASPEAWRTVLGNLSFFPPCLAAAALNFQLAKRHTGRLRRAWNLFGVGILAWGLGQGAYTVLDLTGVAAFPSIADIGYLLLIPCFLLGFLHLSLPGQTRLQRVSFVLDVAIILLAVADVLWHLHLRHAIVGYAGQPFALAVALAYPAFDLLLLALLLAVVVWRPKGLDGLQITLLSAGMASLFLVDSLYSFRGAQGTYTIAGPLDLFWTWAFVAFGATAFIGLTRGTSAPTQTSVRVQQDAAAFVPSIAILISYTALFVAHNDVHSPAIDPVLAALSLLVFARQFLSVIDNRRLNRDLQHQADHDPLTGVLSRSNLSDALDRRIREARERHEVVGVMFVDLDRMKHINDAYGHLIGDQVLQQVALRLRASSRDLDTVARFGGDEFVLAVTVADGQQVASVAQRVLSAVSRPFMVDGRLLHVTASVGVAVCPDDAADAESALRHADLAMYQAKSAGKNTARFFEARYRETRQQQARVEEHLRIALRDGGLELHYQPIVELQGASGLGFEALLRWPSPVLGPVPPLTIVQTAEECGLMPELGEWVLDRAVAQVAAWRQGPARDVYVSVNVSATQFALSDFVEQVTEALETHGVPGSALMLEVTENTLITDIKASVARMDALKVLGVRIALDDFGTGYSSLSYLMQLPVDVLKVDRSFLRTFAEGGEDFVKAIVTLAHHRGARVVAEGVEEAWQANVLRHLHCDLAQGYYFARPMPAEQAERFTNDDVTDDLPITADLPLGV